MQPWKVNNDDDNEKLEIIKHIIDYQRDRHQLRLKKSDQDEQNDTEEKAYDSFTRFEVYNYIKYHMISVTCEQASSLAIYMMQSDVQYSPIFKTHIP